MAREHFSFPVRHARIHFDKDESYRPDQRAADTEYNDFLLEDWLNRVVEAGDSLWEEVSGDLHPVTEPATSFSVIVGSSYVYVDLFDTVLGSGAGATTVTWDLNGSTGDLNSSIGRDWNITHPFGHTNQDWNVNFDRDINFGADNDINLALGRYLTLVGLPTANPGGANRVWNDGGTLKIT